MCVCVCVFVDGWIRRDERREESKRRRYRRTLEQPRIGLKNGRTSG